MRLAILAIEQAALPDEQKASRLADLREAPGIATFWAALFDPLAEPTMLRVHE
jgi:hypothetical protein